MEHKLIGVGVALITPFDENDEVDYNGLKSLIDFVSENGVDYLVVNGTTGESATTTLEEKIEILSFVKQNNIKKLPIVYGIGGNNTKDVLNRISSTDYNGVDAVLSVCPYYVKPSQAGIIAHFTAIADACPVPVLLYNVPGRTVSSIAIPSILLLAKHKNIIGLKDATSSLEQAMELSKKCDKEFLLISGDDNLVTPQISVGYQGVISVIANGFPKEFSEMTWNGLKGNFKEAAIDQFRFLDFDDLLYRESNPVGIKMVCEIRGICDSRVRLPLLKASQELKAAITESMKNEGFL